MKKLLGLALLFSGINAAQAGRSPKFSDYIKFTEWTEEDVEKEVSVSFYDRVTEADRFEKIYLRNECQKEISYSKIQTCKRVLKEVGKAYDHTSSTIHISPYTPQNAMRLFVKNKLDQTFSSITLRIEEAEAEKNIPEFDLNITKK
jgi:hypothetical protein